MESALRRDCGGMVGANCVRPPPETVRDGEGTVPCEMTIRFVRKNSLSHLLRKCQLPQGGSLCPIPPRIETVGVDAHIDPFQSVPQRGTP